MFLDFEVTARQRYGAPPAASARLGFDVAVEGVVLNKLRLKIGLRAVRVMTQPMWRHRWSRRA